MKVRIEGQPLNSVLGIKSRFVGNGGDECSVEELALQYYAAEAGGSWIGQLNHRLQGPVDLPLSTVLSCFFRDVGIVSFAFSEILRLRLYCSVSLSVLLTIHLNVHIKPIAALSMMQRT